MARRAAALLVLVTIAAACGSGDDPTIALPGETTTTAPPAGGGPSPAPAEPGAAPTSSTPAPGTGPGGAPGDPAAPPVGDEPSAGWPALDASGPPGSFAPDILGAARSGRVEVRVSSQSGREPRQRTLDHLAQVLRSVTGGKDVVVTGGPPITPRDSWSAADLRAAAGQVDQGGGTAVIRLLYVGGRFADADGVLGVAVRGDAAAVFSDEVDAAGSPLVGGAAIEDAVTVHELGHLLGLVDLHLSTGREDPEHPGHSRNRRSVMYWAVESTLVADVLSGGPPREFDDDDLADLQRIRTGG